MVNDCWDKALEYTQVRMLKNGGLELLQYDCPVADHMEIKIFINVRYLPTARKLCYGCRVAAVPQLVTVSDVDLSEASPLCLPCHGGDSVDIPGV